ncbi:hypothetical protein [Variovorax sp. 160MFSha2.1]
MHDRALSSQPPPPARRLDEADEQDVTGNGEIRNEEVVAGT